nr:fatty acyl-CoA reductase 1-like isoform X1 [Rhipicephalus microplus]
MNQLRFSKCAVLLAGRRSTATITSRTVKATTKLKRIVLDENNDSRAIHVTGQSVMLQLKTPAVNLCEKRLVHTGEHKGERRHHLFPRTTFLSCAQGPLQPAHQEACIVAPAMSRHERSPTPVPVHRQNESCRVSDFYNGREVFITGGTGFVGKVLLEKLLRSCCGLRRVYLLVRSKRGEEPQARLKKMFNSEIFEHLKREQPEAFEKVTAIAGDLAQPGLGLGESDYATLVDNVSIVFHSGATVNFEDPLRDAFELNVLGTRRVLDICKKMSNIRAFVHVSTAYCNFDKPEIDEVIDTSSENIRKFCKKYADNAAMIPEDQSLLGYPNTYTLTKKMAELLLADERENVPVVIVRASAVTAALSEPIPGWLDNYKACTGIVVALGTGQLSSLITDKKCLADIIPVDIVANTLICIAWHTSTKRPTGVKVYHCASGSQQQHTWAEMADAMQKSILRHPLPNAVFYPKFSVNNIYMWHNINLYCLRYLPAQAADLGLMLIGRKPRYVQRYKNIRKVMDIPRFFISHGWLFRTENVVSLARELTPKDKQLFNIDVRSLDWYPYWDNYLLGIRKYLFNAKDSDIPKDRSHLNRLYAIRLSSKALLLALTCQLLMTTTLPLW